MRLVSAGLLLALSGCAAQLSAPTEPSDLPRTPPNIKMFRYFEALEMAPRVVGAFAQFPLRISNPRVEPEWGGVTAVDESGYRYVVTWQVLVAVDDGPDNVIMLLSADPEARADVLAHVEARLEAVEEARYAAYDPEIGFCLNHN